MKIGDTQSISDSCFPNMDIDVSDRNGNKLAVRDKVYIHGCVADYGYIGYSNGVAVVYFEADGVSVQWQIDENVRQKIELY